MCKQCADKVEENSGGTRSGRSVPVLLLPDGIPSLVILPLKPKFVPIPQRFSKILAKFEASPVSI